MKCTQEELDSFVNSQIDIYGKKIKHIEGVDADKLLCTIVDLLWPDIPIGFTLEDFIESWNRLTAKRETAQK